MSMPTVLINRYFDLLRRRNFQAAEFLLRRIKSRTRSSEVHRGYLVALEGMLLSLRSGDKRQFINNMQKPETYREEFLKQAQSRFHADYDRGFFLAWVDFCQKK